MFWLDGSIFEPIVKKLQINSEGTTNDIETQFFVEINLFIVLSRVKCIPLHYTEFPSKQ